MLSAPPVLVMPVEPSPLIQQTYDWATQTPESSPPNSIRAPLAKVDNQLHLLQEACHPIFEQMLACIASHTEVMQASTLASRHELIHALCQPFFEQISESLYDEISGVSMLVTADVDAQRAETSHSSNKPRLSLEHHLGFGDDDSTDADDVSAFASLLSSDGEECPIVRSKDASNTSQSANSTFLPVTYFEDEIQSLQEFEGSLMVCRHWKSKGWCRYASQCKFSHPEHKRGLNSKFQADMSDAPLLPCPSTRKRAKKNKSTNAHSEVRFFKQDESNTFRYLVM